MATPKKKAAKKIVAKKKTTKKPVKSASKIKKLYVAFVLDKSGSMEVIRDATISAFNEQVEKIKLESKKIKTNVSLTVFDAEVNKVFFNEPVEKLDKLTRATYVPSTTTALYDAVGDTLDAMEVIKNINKPNAAVLMLIVTDGAENASRKFTRQQIAERIQKLQKNGNWTFTYLGANQDMSVVSKSLNIPMANTAAYAANTKGVIAASAMTSNSLGGYYRSVSRGVVQVRDFFGGSDKDDDKDKDSNSTKDPVVTNPPTPVK
jgi:hypothetical protein